MISGKACLGEAFAAAKAQGRIALVPYICAGDPDAATSGAVLDALRERADVIELGVPYGDPLADGPAIAAAAQRALAAGMTLDGVLALARDAVLRESPPLVLFSYLNPILQYGIERFADGLVEAGACGAIVPDVPLEEIGDLRRAFAARALALPLLVAPTTPPARAVAIAEASDGFIYLVSRLGVTGTAREPDFDWAGERVAHLRRASATPVAVGFGISSPEHVARLRGVADGVVIGSAVVEASIAGARGGGPAGAARRVGEFTAALR